MPKEIRVTTSYRASPIEAARREPSLTTQGQASHRNAAIWSDADDQILIAARASGLNWQPIATRNFPTKTANACRKRHERLMERRNHDDWDTRRLDTLAIEYMECRREMWTVLAARIGERWGLIETKCMEKGWKNLQAMARAAHKRSVAGDHANQRGNDQDHEGDSGIGYSDEDAEMEVGDGGSHASTTSNVRPLQPVQPVLPVQSTNGRPERYVPPPLPLYQPPLSARERGTLVNKPHAEGMMSNGSSLNREQHRGTLDEHVQRGVSIRSMLSHPEELTGA